MILSIIVAMTKNNVIGLNNEMPWKLKADLKHFQKITTNNTVIMGRKTFDSIGKVLPNRRNIIISSNKNLIIENAEVVHSLQEAIELTNEEKEVFIIGGGKLYKEAINKCNKLYITIVNANINGDTFFPMLNNFKLTQNEDTFYSIKADSNNDYDCDFYEYKIG